MRWIVSLCWKYHSHSHAATRTVVMATVLLLWECAIFYCLRGFTCQRTELPNIRPKFPQPCYSFQEWTLLTFKSVNTTHLTTRSMQRSPFLESVTLTAGQEIPRHCRFHESQPLVPYPETCESVHSFMSCIFNIYINISLLCHPVFLLHSGFSSKILRIYHSSHACYIPCPFYPTRYGHRINIRWSLQVMRLTIQSSPAS